MRVFVLVLACVLLNISTAFSGKGTAEWFETPVPTFDYMRE